jgi:aspartate/methionine/tyrosine aminotransferase
MIIRPSLRGTVEPFHAMDVLAEANRLRTAGKPVISLAVGQPSDPVPERVRQAAARAVEIGRIGYTDALGLPTLREAIAGHYAEEYGVDVSPDRIAVTTGSSGAFNLAFLAMFEVGDRVALAEPGYPAYRNIINALGLVPVEIPVGEKGYLGADDLAAAHSNQPLKGLLFASPGNPTGAIVPEAELELLLRRARKLGVAVISDEIYHRLDYGTKAMTALAFDQDVAVINSFSKYYCMTGWRIGWMVLPQPMLRQVERLQQSLYISAPEISQVAATAALQATADYELIKDRYRESRALLMERLPRLGFALAAPMDGAFYAYCDVSRHTNDSMEFARRLLAETFVAATPGRDFDMRNGHRFLRLSYAGSPQDIAEALDRIEAFVG